MILKISWLFLYFYTNSQIDVGGTTTFDIGNDVNIKGGVINTGRAQGVIGGDVNIESLQDTATYDSKQKNMGFSADIDIAVVAQALVFPSMAAKPILTLTTKPLGSSQASLQAMGASILPRTVRRL